MTHIEIDGAPPAPDQLWATVSAYGHFTAMQVRNGKVRGLALHMRRLEAANREAFGVGLNGERPVESRGLSMLAEAYASVTWASI